MFKRLLIAAAVTAIVTSFSSAAGGDGKACIGIEEYEKTGTTQGSCRFRSPSNVFLFSLKDLLPPNMFMASGAMDYAISGEGQERISNMPVIASVAGDVMMIGGTIIPVGFGERHGFMPLIISGLSLWGAAFLSDSMLYGQLTGLRSSSGYIESVRNAELEVPQCRVDYKDPFMAAAASMAIPGGGYFYQGRNVKGFIWLGVETAAAVTAAVIGAVNDTNEQPASPLIYALGARCIFLIPEMCTAMMDTDAVNEVHIKQLLAKGSPYRITEDPADVRHPWLAFTIASLTVPGLGNLYAGNSDGCKGLLLMTVLGGAMSLLSGPIADLAPTWNLEPALFNTGIAVMGLAKLADIATAPAAAELYNYVHAGKRYAAGPGVISAPVVIGSAPGIYVGLNF